MHLAVPQHIYDDISKEHKNVIELFGSVMNKSFKNYCGLFYDLEKYFGNIGNFFDIKIIFKCKWTWVLRISFRG